MPNDLIIEHANRRWALARRVGFLEGAIKGAVMALRNGRDPRIVAESLDEMLHAEDADERAMG